MKNNSNLNSLAERLSNLNELRNCKALLAFSHGVDSTALFYLLNEAEIDFDCAFVNYKTRAQSDVEEAAARELCAKFEKNIHVLVAPLDLEHGANFEMRARELRYAFFDELCIKNNYDALILAHQLNDCFEWFLMQFAKGSGAINAIGFEPLSARQAKFENKSKKIKVFRPLLNIQKSKLAAYLDERNLKYFIDNSNLNTKFKRNFIRANFSDDFIKEFASGVARSMELFRLDKKALLGDFVYEKGEFFVIRKDERELHLIDKACKKLGIMISQKTRKEIERNISNLNQKGCVVSHKIAIGANSNFVFVAPYIKAVSMSKDFKEKCRKMNIPPLIRGFLARNLEYLSVISNLN